MAHIVDGTNIIEVTDEREIVHQFEKWLEYSRQDGEIEDYDRCPGVLAWDIELNNGLFVQVEVK